MTVYKSLIGWTILFICVCLAVSPTSFSLFAICDYFNDGFIRPPGLLATTGSYPYAYKWRGNDPPKITAWCNHFRVYVKRMGTRSDQDVIISQEFQGNVRVLYDISRDECIVNPEITWFSPDMVDSEDSYGQTTYRKKRSTKIQVSYIAPDEQFIKKERTIERNLAYVFQLYSEM